MWSIKRKNSDGAVVSAECTAGANLTRKESLGVWGGGGFCQNLGQGCYVGGRGMDRWAGQRTKSQKHGTKTSQPKNSFLSLQTESGNLWGWLGKKCGLESATPSLGPRERCGRKRGIPGKRVKNAGKKPQEPFWSRSRHGQSGVRRRHGSKNAHRVRTKTPKETDRLLMASLGKRIRG